MATAFDDAHRLKFGLFAHGLVILETAGRALRELNGVRPLTPADYASTSGVILRLDHDVWVNVPIADYNANFVGSSPFVLDYDSGGFFVQGRGLASRATFWLPPEYHGGSGTNGRPYNNYVYTHGDRARLAPIKGCAMRCTFCNIPYEDRYSKKPIDAMLEAVRTSLCDPIQPAYHLLISGGTPSRRDVGYLRDVYSTVLQEFPELEVDIMMVPIEGLFDLHELDRLGLNQISINLEIYNRAIAKDVMRQKYRQGLDFYLTFMGRAAEILGPGRVRSMLMVGLEPIEDTLAGIAAIVERGCVPVLSPFRPDPATPLSSLAPPTEVELEEFYLRAAEITAASGTVLGPQCPPCTHNTLNFAGTSDSSPPPYPYPLPQMV